MADNKHILVVIRQAPFYSSARESIDLALALAAFELPISLLFTEQGVWCLSAQNSAQVEHKPLDKMLAALGLYDIEKVFVGEQDLACAGLTELTATAEIIDEAGIKALYHQAAQVIRL